MCFKVIFYSSGRLMHVSQNRRCMGFVLNDDYTRWICGGSVAAIFFDEYASCNASDVANPSKGRATFFFFFFFFFLKKKNIYKFS